VTTTIVEYAADLYADRRTNRPNYIAAFETQLVRGSTAYIARAWWETQLAFASARELAALEIWEGIVEREEAIWGTNSVRRRVTLEGPKMFRRLAEFVGMAKEWIALNSEHFLVPVTGTTVQAFERWNSNSLAERIGACSGWWTASSYRIWWGLPTNDLDLCRACLTNMVWIVGRTNWSAEYADAEEFAVYWTEAMLTSGPTVVGSGTAVLAAVGAAARGRAHSGVVAYERSRSSGVGAGGVRDGRSPTCDVWVRAVAVGDLDFFGSGPWSTSSWTLIESIASVAGGYTGQVRVGHSDFSNIGLSFVQMTNQEARGYGLDVLQIFRYDVPGGFSVR